MKRRLIRRWGCALLSGSMLLSACASTDYGARAVGSQGPATTPQLQTLEANLRYQYDDLEQRVRRSGRLVDDPALDAMMRRIGCEIAGEFCPELRFYILETSEFNATMAPNGMMLVNSGLLLRIEGEDELAFVMAHEFGHYFENHMFERIAAVRNANAMGSTLSWALVFAGAGALATLGYLPAMAGALEFSRDQEREADLFAARFNNEHNYNAAAGVRAWENLRAELTASSNERTRRAVTRGSMFSTHPLTEERITYLTAAARPDGPGPSDKAAYRALIRPHLSRWLELEVAQRDAGATLVLIERMAQQGTDLGVLEFARGEVYRVRDEAGDAELALAAYQRAAEQADANVAVWRQIGVMQQKLGAPQEAGAAFARYLELAPDAPDRQLIASMLAGLQTSSGGE